MSANVTVCLVTYNSAAVLPACLASIPHTCKLLVYDNSSRDNSTDLILRSRPDADIIRGDSNLGFGGGHNRVLARVTTTFALVLNPDTVLSPNAINQFVNVAELNPTAAIIGAAHMGDDGKPQSSSKPDYTYYSRWAKLHQPGALPEKVPHIKHWPAIQGHACVDMVSGAAMFLRIALFKGMGFFDPNIFLYFEDDDLCIRARQAGYTVLYDANILITHLGDRSTRRSLYGTYLKQKHYAWSRLYLYRKYVGSHGRAPALSNVIVNDRARYIRHFIKAILTFDTFQIAKNLGGIFGVGAFKRQPGRAPL